MIGPRWLTAAVCAAILTIAGSRAGGQPLPLTVSVNALRKVDFTMSRDGKRLVLVTLDVNYDSGTWVRDLRTGRTSLVEISNQPDGIESPAFSPDGRWFAFKSKKDGSLWRVRSSGGRSTRIYDAKHVGPFDWADDGSIVFAQDGGLAEGSGLWRVAGTGGEATFIASFATREAPTG